MLPEIKSTKDNVTVLNAFLGINKGLHGQESEFEDMTNMTLDYYPVLANRKKRGLISTFTKPMGILGGSKLAYVDDNKLYYDFSLIKELEATNKERQLVMMGAHLCVFPDGIIYNTYDNTFSNVQNTFTSSGEVTMRMCKLDGTEFTGSNTYIGSTAPDTSTYQYWLDTSNSKSVILKMWSSTYSMWTSVATTYVKISATGIGKGFNAYDSATFSGISIKGYNDYDFNDTLIIYACDDDYVIVAGLMDLYHTQTEAVTVERKLPEMDYVCELDNRIWGCSSENHEVYACKQGSPWNWNSYAGLDSDSYAATVGTQGNFTGIVAYGGYVFFFKEDGYHKLYGTKPSNYEMIWKPSRGVADGCYKSIAIVDEVLFFKSRDAIVAYDGSESTVSDKLGIEPFYDAVAVGYRNKYYCSMRDADYNYKLYVYDITKGAWTIEDKLHIIYAAYANNGTYMIDSNNQLYVINNEKIYRKYFPREIIGEANKISVGGVDYDPNHNFPRSDLYCGDIISGTLENTLEWSFTTGDLGLDNPYNKYLKRINVRFLMDVNSKLKIEVEYDSSGTWDYVTEFYATRKRSYEIPIAVRRADHVRFRLSGWGKFQLFSIAKAVEAGSGETNGES